MKRKWYRINEQKPYVGIEYHVYGEKFGLDTAIWAETHGWWNPITHEDLFRSELITHFMPFPEEPRKKRR
jgi:hypothetical protein